MPSLTPCRRTEPLVITGDSTVGCTLGIAAGRDRGHVLETRDANGAVTGFYVLLPDGVQKITASSPISCAPRTLRAPRRPTLVSPDKLVHIPLVEVLDIGYYPSGKLTFVDTAANPG